MTLVQAFQLQQITTQRLLIMRKLAAMLLYSAHQALQVSMTVHLIFQLSLCSVRLAQTTQNPGSV